MLIAALIILGSGAALVTLGLIVFPLAPQGYEDTTGFHFGPEEPLCPQTAHFGALAEAKVTA